MVRRAFRLLPLCWLTILVIVALSLWYMVRPQPLLVQGEADGTRTDIAAHQVLEPYCQSVHSAGPKTRRYQLTVLSDQRERRQMVDSQFTTHAKRFDLSGKRGLVTGGTRGIGMMIARGLLQAGVRVVISSRSAEACAQAQEQLR